jgi:hypothetical protein
MLRRVVISNRRCQFLLLWVSTVLLQLRCRHIHTVNSFTPTTTNSARRCPSAQLIKAQQQQQQQQQQLDAVRRVVYKSPTSATTTTTTASSSSTSSALWMVANVPKDDGSGVSYGERSRRYRRDVFAYGDWIRHRDSERFIGNLVDIFNSAIVRQLTGDCLVLAGIGAFIVAYNAFVVTGYDGIFDGIHHDPIVSGTYPLLSMPGAFFSLTSPFLSFLLGTLFRIL